MSPIQRLILRLVPHSWAIGMEAESRRWIVSCPCGYEQSIWDLGGIRWKATGSTKMWRRCPQCGQLTGQTMTYREVD